MDKLKPIIEQKFWIFLGLALLVPFVGWYIESSGYATGVEKREETIDNAFKSVNLSEPIVNEKWSVGADQIVKEEKKRLEQSQKQLWLSQVGQMDWPASVAPWMKDVTYEGEIPVRAQEEYSQGYFRQLAAIEKRLRPFDYLTGEGVLLFDGYKSGASNYTHVPDGQWAIHSPTDTEMWNAQIDLWLVRAVFDSIVSINSSATKITEAPVRQLLELKLRGGERDYSPASTSGGSGDSSGDSEMFSSMEMSGPSGGGTGSGAGVKTQVQFDLSEELGPAGNEGGRMGGGGMEEMLSSSSGSAESTNDAPKGPRRYVDDDENAPFRTRAFVLGVIMDQQRLPQFLAELSRSDWPIQIIRVQTRTLNPEQLSLAGGTGRTGPRGSSMRPGGFRSSSPGAFMPEDGDGGYGSGAANPFSSGSATSGRPRPSSAAGIGTGNAAGLVQQALSDPNLSEVWIGGLITLFRPVEDKETGDTQDVLPSDDTTTTPAANGTETDPTESQESTVPDESSPTTPPADDSTAPETETETDPTSADDASATGNNPLPTETPPESTDTPN